MQGYEGEGGLHALLHARGWVTSLSAGSILSDSDLTLFRLTMTLTEEGEMHQDEIVELCHRFIALLREEPPQKRIQVCLFVCVCLCVCVCCVSLYSRFCGVPRILVLLCLFSCFSFCFVFFFFLVCFYCSTSSSYLLSLVVSMQVEIFQGCVPEGIRTEIRVLYLHEY